MNVHVEAKELHRIVSTAARGAARHAGIEILKGVLLEAEGGFLSAVCTDMEVTMAVSARVAKGRPRGKVVVADARWFAKAVKELAGVLELAVDGVGDDRVLAVRDEGGTESRWRLLPFEDFPRVHQEFDSRATLLELPRWAIRLLDPSLKVVSDDMSRPVLTGVRVVVKHEEGSRAAKDGSRPSTLTVEATDSYRLHRTEVGLRSSAAFAALIPGRSLKELRRLVGPEKPDELPVKVGVLADYPLLARFTVLLPGGPARVWTRLIDGQFPNVDQLIPEGCQLAVTLDAGALEEAARKLVKIAPQTGRSLQTPARVKIGGGKVKLRAVDVDSGERSVTVDADIDGVEFEEVGFNGEFLAQAMECMFEGDVEWRLISPLRPVIFVQEPNEDRESRELHLLMPTRLSS